MRNLGKGHSLSFIYEKRNLNNKIRWKQELSLKKIFDKVTEGIFDMSNVRIFKEIERKKWGFLYSVMSSVS